MKKLISLCALTLMMPLSVYADQSDEASFTGGIGLYSHYVGRGRVQADDNPALQGSLNYNLPLTENTDFYAGVWGTNVDFNDGHNAKVELDLYAGLAHSIEDLTLKAGFIGYWYPTSSDHLNYDHYEYMASLLYDFGAVNTDMTIKYSPDFFGSSGDATYYHFGIQAPITEAITLKANLGRQEVDVWHKFGFRDYDHWGAGLVYQAKELHDIAFSLEYKNTNISRSACPKRWCDGLVVAGISKSW